jgi:NSS family neurotransmitter:Na+ symporter
LVTLFIGWLVPGNFNEELNVSKVGAKTTGYLKFMTRWVAPLIIGFGLFISVFDLLKGLVS